MRCNILLLTKLSFISLCLLSSTIHAENLMEVYKAAVENDPTILAAEASLKSKQQDKNIAMADLLPKLNGQVAAERIESESESTDNDPIISTVPLENYSYDERDQLSGSISLDLALVDMQKWFTFKSSQHNSESAKLKFYDDQQSLIKRVIEAYIQILREKENLASTIAEETAIKQQLNQTQQRFNVGLVAITEVHEAQAAYDLAHVTRLTNEGTKQVAFEALSLLTGKTHESIYKFSDSMPVSSPSPATMEDWVNLAMTNSYQLRIADKNFLAAKNGMRASRSALFPTLSLSAKYQTASSEGGTRETSFDIIQNPSDPSSSTNINSTNSDDWDEDSNRSSIGLYLNVPLFNGGAGYARARKSGADLITAEENLRGTKRSVEQQTRAAFIKLQSQILQVAARKQSITSTESALDAIQNGYNVGTRNIVDVLDAQRNVFAAKRDFANAKYDYILALVELKKVAGVLTPDDVQALNEWIVATDS